MKRADLVVGETYALCTSPRYGAEPVVLVSKDRVAGDKTIVDDEVCVAMHTRRGLLAHAEPKPAADQQPWEPQFTRTRWLVSTWREYELAEAVRAAKSKTERVARVAQELADDAAEDALRTRLAAALCRPNDHDLRLVLGRMDRGDVPGSVRMMAADLDALLAIIDARVHGRR